MNLFGTISLTLRIVGANGLGFLNGLTCNAFRWASVPGNALMRGIPLSGGRSGNISPSSRLPPHWLLTDLRHQLVERLVVAGGEGTEGVGTRWSSELFRIA